MSRNRSSVRTGAGTSRCSSSKDWIITNEINQWNLVFISYTRPENSTLLLLLIIINNIIIVDTSIRRLFRFCLPVSGPTGSVSAALLYIGPDVSHSLTHFRTLNQKALEVSCHFSLEGFVAKNRKGSSVSHTQGQYQWHFTVIVRVSELPCV